MQPNGIPTGREAAPPPGPANPFADIVAGADVAYTRTAVARLEQAIAHLVAELTRLDERTRGATMELARLFGAIASEIRLLGDRLGEADRVRRLEAMRGQIQARLAQLGAVVGSDGAILALPSADPSLVGELMRLKSELASALADLQALILRLGLVARGFAG